MSVLVGKDTKIVFQGITGSAGAILAVLAFAALVAKVHPGIVMVGALAIGAIGLRG